MIPRIRSDIVFLGILCCFFVLIYWIKLNNKPKAITFSWNSERNILVYDFPEIYYKYRGLILNVQVKRIVADTLHWECIPEFEATRHGNLIKTRLYQANWNFANFINDFARRLKFFPFKKPPLHILYDV